MKCGVKFCGGCNPRYERGTALEDIRRQAPDLIEFDYAEAGAAYDALLVIGGCTNCCAAHCDYDVTGSTLKMWDEAQIPEIIEQLEQLSGLRKPDSGND